MSSAPPTSLAQDSELSLGDARTLARWWAWAMATVTGRGTMGGSLFSIADQAVVSGTSFLTAVIVGRASLPEDLGRYYLTLTIILTLVGLQEALVAAPYMVFGARRRGRDLAEFTGSMWVQHLALTAVGTMVVISLAISAPRLNAARLAPSLWAVSAIVPWVLLREGIRRFSFARLRSSVALAMDVGVCAIQLGSLLALWSQDRLSIPLAFGVMGLASGLACCGWLASKPGRPLISRERLRDDWRNNWAFSRWTVLSYFTVDTIPFMMPWLIGIAAGPAAIGLYGGCATLLGVTNILVHGAGNYMRPKAAHAFAVDGIPALRTVLLLTGGVFAAVFGLLCLAFVATGDMLAVVVFGPEFRGTGWLLTLLAVNVLAGSLGYVAGSGLWALGQPRSSMIADACMLVVTLVSAWLLIAPYGPVGAALAAAIGTTIGTALKMLTVHLAIKGFEPTTSIRGPDLISKQVINSEHPT